MKTVCITQMDDGTFTVELEPAEPMESTEQEMPEGTPEDKSEDMAEGESENSYPSIDEALSAARGMFGDAQEAGPMIPGEEEVQASFVDGYKTARGGPGQGF